MADFVYCLDMCTETLGSETGAMHSACDIEVGIMTKTSRSSVKEKKASLALKKAGKPEYPPLLTTLHGEGRLRLYRKQEEGRLLLYPYKPSLLEADRSGGRLILRYLPSGPVREPEEITKVEEKDREGFSVKKEDGGFFVYGGGRKYRRAGRCIGEQGGGPRRNKMSAADIFKSDSLWVTIS